jgi:hypothetical protein
LEDIDVKKLSPHSTRLVAALAAGFFVTATSVHANCSLSIETAQSAWSIQFDPTQDDRSAKTFDVAFVNSGTSDCTGTSRFELNGQAFGLSTPDLPDNISYQLIDDRNGVDVTPRAGGRSAPFFANRAIHVQPGERAVVRFTFEASPDNQTSYGLYTQDVALVVNDSSGLPLAQRPLVLGINIPAAAIMGLRGQFQRIGGTPTIRLGELEMGEQTLDTSLFVASTSGYSITVSSANNGALMIPSTGWRVPYSLMLGTNAMNLAQISSHQVVSRRARSDSYKLSVNIGSVVGKRAGNYSDTLTFTVSAF